MPRPRSPGALVGFTARSDAPALVPCAGAADACAWLAGVASIVGRAGVEITGRESDGMCTAGTRPGVGEGRGTGRGSARKAAATPPPTFLNFLANCLLNDQPVAVISIHPPRSSPRGPAGRHSLSNVRAVSFLYLSPTNLPFEVYAAK